MELSDLREPARSPAWRDRAEAATLLARIGGEEADDQLAVLLDDEDTAVIDAAAQALLRRADLAGARRVVLALENEDTEVDEHILWAAHAVRHEGKPVIELFSVLARDGDPVVRRRAKDALDWLGA